MIAAKTLAERGMKVTLVDRQSELGGTINLAKKPPFKERMGWIADYYNVEFEKLGVELKLDMEATADKIAEMNPDAVLVATGSKSVIPGSIPGITGENVYTIEDILSGKAGLKNKKVMIIGAGVTGLETAEYLCHEGNTVVLADMLDKVAPNANHTNVADVCGRLKEYNAQFMMAYALKEIKKDGVVLERLNDKINVEVAADAVVLSLGFRPDNHLVEELKEKGIHAQAIGNAVKDGTIAPASRSGFEAARKLFKTSVKTPSFITAPEEMAEGRREYESTNIPTVLSETTNRNHDFYVFLTQRYNLGFKRDIPQAENDTTPAKQEFVPVTSFIHTIQVERARHGFNSYDEVADGYYQNTYFDKDNKAFVRDSTTYVGIKNTIGIALLEGFNKYAKAGLTAFASYKISKYTLMNKDGGPLPDKYNENEIFVGGELSKREGNILHYHAIGEVGLAGKAIGQFNVKGDIDLNFPLWKDTVSLIARGEVSNQLAPFYMRHYHSKHFMWDNDMDKEFRTRIEGELSIARWKTRLRAGVENIKNYTYFNQQATPEQKSGSLQVLSASLNQDFKLGIFHLDNEVTWQKSSDQTVLPLPDLSLYHNFYMQFKLAKKVLSVQLGADVRYFTKYNAPAYMPAIQNFYLQPEEGKVEIGGYPIVNVYANLHLKRTRFYVMMYHVNQGISRPDYFLSPHYPINPRVLKFGLSWNFYD